MAPVSAATTFIGDFDSTFQSATASSGTSDSEGPTNFGGPLFDTREIVATSFGPSSVSTVAGGGSLNFGALFQTTGTGSVIYTNSGGNVDLSPFDFFSIDFLGADLPGADITLTVSTGTGSGTADFTGLGTLPTGPPTTLVLNFATFGAIDFTDVISLELFLTTGPAVSGISQDMEFDNFLVSNVPEPGTFMLLGTGLLGLGLVQRRRSRS